MHITKKIFVSTLIVLPLCFLTIADKANASTARVAVTDTGIGTGSTNTNGGIGTGSTNTNGGIGTGNTNGQRETIVNPLNGISDLPSFLKVVFAAMIQLFSAILVLAFVWIGFLFVKAQGAPAKIEEAKKAFFWTVIGGLILLSANAILAVVQSTATSLGN